MAFANYDDWNGNTLGGLKVGKFFKRAFGGTFKKAPRIIGGAVTGYLTGGTAGAVISGGAMAVTGRRRGEKWYQGALLGAGTGAAIGSVTGLVTGKGYVGTKYTSWKQAQVAQQAAQSMIPQSTKLMTETPLQKVLKSPEDSVAYGYKLDVPELLTPMLNPTTQTAGLGSNFQPGMEMPMPQIISGREAGITEASMIPTAIIKYWYIPVGLGVIGLVIYLAKK